MRIPFALLLGLFAPSLAGADGWATRGPYGGAIQALAIAPTDPTTLYASAREGGLYRSTDAGGSWAPTNLWPGDLRALAVDPRTPTTLFAGGVYGGASRYGVHRSTDGGRTWQVSYAGLPLASQVEVLRLDPANPSTVYAGMFDQGLVKSTDSGATWTPINTGLPDLYVTALVIDRLAPATLYTSTWAVGGVFKSTDGGQTWSAAGLNGLWARALAIDPVAHTTLYAGANGQVFKSTNGGGSWVALLPPSGAGQSLAIDPGSPGTLYTGTSNAGVLKSTDGGASWKTANAGLTSLTVNDLAIDPATTATVYAGTGDGVFKSTDGGASWSPSNLGLAALDVEDLVVDPQSAAQVYAGVNGQGVFRSSDSGAAWEPSSKGLGNLNVLALTADPSSPGTLYAAPLGGVVFRSTDAAGRWEPRGAVAEARVSSLAVDPSNPPTLYATTEAVEGSGGRIYKSTDAAATWAVAAPPSMQAIEVLVDPASSKTVYAATACGVYKSTDAGDTWDSAGAGLPYAYVYALAMPPADSATLFAGTQLRGVYKTTDAGVSWSPANTGLPPEAVVYDIVVHPTSPATVYAATIGGIYRSSDSGGSWARVNSGLPGWPRIRALALPAGDASTLFAAPEHGSVWQSTTTTRAFVKGDLDGDTLPDLVFQNAARIELWLMNGVARAAEAAVSPEASSADWLVRGVDDFDADGGNDLVLWNQATGQVDFWLMNGPTRRGAPLPLGGAPTLPTNWELSATGDLDGDGQADLVWRNLTSLRIVIWTLHLTSKARAIVPAPAQAVDASWSIVAARDFNGDGFADFLWQNRSSGKLVTWYLKVTGFLRDAVVRTSGQFTTPPSAGNNNWQAVASADYSGSHGPGTPPLGSPDLVWRNQTSGNQVVWHMDFASTRVYGEFTSPAANTPACDWTIVGPR